MIKIISGYTLPGGATVALINLTNMLNKHGHETLMIGPHDWFADKCNSRVVTNNLTFHPDDNLIFHYIKQHTRPNARKVVLTCHEKYWFPVGKINKYWDTAVFLHEQHRQYHIDYTGDYAVIPNIKSNLTKSVCDNKIKIAGIIGTIEVRKQTHVSIKRALDDGCDKVYMYGKIGDPSYFEQHVKHLISDRVIHKGFTDDKQQIYNSVNRVYHSSQAEVACLIKDECYQTGVEFFGNEETTHEVSPLVNEQIVNLWLQTLEINA